MYVGPLYDAKRDQLVGANTFKLVGLNDVPVQVALGKRSEGWRRKASVGIARGHVDMFLEPKQEPPAGTEGTAAPARGLHATACFAMPTAPPQDPRASTSDLAAGRSSCPSPPSRSLSFNTPAAAALKRRDGTARGLQPRHGYVLRGQCRGQVRREAASQAGGRRRPSRRSSLLRRFDHRVGPRRWQDSKRTDPRRSSVEAEFRGERSQPASLCLRRARRKQFAIVFQNGKLWLLDANAKSLRRASVSGQGDIFAATFKSSNRLLVADRTTRVSEYMADT